MGEPLLPSLKKKHPELLNLDSIKNIANKLGYELICKLQEGDNGIAYKLNNKKVLKITADKGEYLVAKKLEKKNLKHYCYVYKTEMVFNDVYAIVCEYLQPLSKADLEYLKTNKAIFDKIKNEFRQYDIKNPTDFDYIKNLGIKNGYIACFDVSDFTL